MATSIIGESRQVQKAVGENKEINAKLLEIVRVQNEANFLDRFERNNAGNAVNDLGNSKTKSLKMKGELNVWYMVQKWDNMGCFCAAIFRWLRRKIGPWLRQIIDLIIKEVAQFLLPPGFGRKSQSNQGHSLKTLMCTLLQLKLHSQEGSKHRGRLENKLKNESIYVGNLSADDDEIENQEARATRELGKCMRL